MECKKLQCSHLKACQLFFTNQKQQTDDIMKQKLLSFILLLIVGISAAHAYSFSAVAPSGQTLYYNITSSGSSPEVSVTCPSSTSWSDYTRPTGNLTIPTTVTNGGITYSVTSIGDYAFEYCSGLTSVSIPNSVTSIGYESFEYCSGLASVTIPNSVTSIGNYAFEYCSGLTSVTIPNSVTSIGEGAFRSCSGLTSVTIPNSVTSIGGGAFRSCSGLNSIVVSSGNTVYDSRNNCNAIIETATNTLIAGFQNTTIPNSVTSIGNHAFYGCSGLTSLTIPNSVTSIGYMAFSFCRGLTSVTIPNSVTSIGNWAFQYCSNLDSVPIPNTVTTIAQGLFYGCSGLTSVTIPTTVTTIQDQAFYRCISLTSVTIPNSVTTIESSAFQNCTGLTSVTIPSSVTTIGTNAFLNVPLIIYSGSASGSPWGALYYNRYFEDNLMFTSRAKDTLIGASPSISSANIPSTVTTIGGRAFNGCTSLISVTIPNSVTTIGDSAFLGTGLTSATIPNSVITIGNYAFYNCLGLTSVTIGNSVTTIGDAAFASDTNMTSVTIPNSVIRIGNSAFYNCPGLTSLTIGNSVTSIGNGAFSGCSGLTSLTIPNSVTSIGNSAFYGCSGLTSVSIPNSVTSIGNGAFFGCSGLTSLTIPNSVTSIGNSAFYGCSGLNSVTIPNSVTSIGNSAFYGCSGLTSVTIPNSVTSIGDEAFRSCSGLTSVTIPNSVTTIGYSAFNSCSGLTSVTIPNSVTTIGYSTFHSCSGLTSVTIPNSVTSIGSMAFRDCYALAPLTIPNSVLSIGNTAFDQVKMIFYYGSAGSANDTWGALCRNGFIEDSLFYTNSSKVTLCGAYIDIVTADIPQSVTTIGENAFCWCKKLTKVTIPSSVSRIKWGAFQVCTNLSSVIIGTPQTIDSVTCTFEPAIFYNDRSLQTIEMRKMIPPIYNNPYGSSYPGSSYYYSIVGYVPSNCILKVPCYRDSLYRASDWGNWFSHIVTDCDLPYFDFKAIAPSGDTLYYIIKNTTDRVKVVHPRKYYNYWGEYVKPTDTLVIPAIVQTDGMSYYVTEIESDAFRGCNGITAVTIPRTIVEIGNNAFCSCSCLSTVNYNATACLKYNNEVFTECPISTINIGDNVRILPEEAFTGLDSLRSVRIPDSVQTIWPGAFGFCTLLDTVVIGSSVSIIGDYVFENCSSLKYVKVRSNIPPFIDSNTFLSVPNNCMVSVPCNRDSVYRASDWGRLFSHIVADTNCSDCVIGLDDLPYTDNFDSYTTSTTTKTGVQPDCWTLVHQDVTMTDEYKPMIYCSSVNAHSGNYSLILNKRGIYAMPEFEGDVNTLQLSFYLKQTQTKYQLQVGVMADLTDASTFVPVATLDNGSNITSSLPQTVNFSSYTGSGRYIAFRNTLAPGNTGDYSCNYIDDLTLTQPEVFTISATANPTAGGTVTGAGSYTDGSTCTLTATPASGYTFANWTIGNSVVSTNPTYSFTVTSNRTLTANFTPIVICGFGLDDLPFTENFDHYTTSTTAKTGVEPDCWTLAHQDVSMTDEYKPMIYYSSANAHSGNYSLILNKRGIYAMPEFEGNVRALKLSMYLKQSAAKYQLQVGVMSDLDNSSTFVPVATIDNSSTNIEHVTVSFASYTGSGHYIAFRNILAPGNTGDYSCNYIDDLTITTYYDFLAVAPTGDTLYYIILDSNNVTVVSPIPIDPTEIDYLDSLEHATLDSLAQPSNSLYNNIPDSDSGTKMPSFASDTKGHAYKSGAMKYNGTVNIPASVTHNGTTYSVARINDYAFYKCDSVISVTIPDNVVSIGKWAFAFDSILGSVSLGSSVTDIGFGAFYGCLSLTDLVLPDPMTPSCDTCHSTPSTPHPHSHCDTCHSRIGDHAFYGLGKRNLTPIPITLTIPRSVIYIGDNAFAESPCIATVNYNADSCTYMGSTSSPVFENDMNFHTLNIGSTVKIIPANAFYGCSGINSLTIPASVKAIDSNAFYGCGGIGTLTFPASVSSIGSSAFAGCSGLTSITAKRTVAPSTSANAFDGIPDDIPVYIPCGSRNSYDSCWSHFTNFIEEMDAHVTVNSADNSMGTARVVNQPTCASPTSTVVATPNTGYVFTSWTEGDIAVSTSATYSFSVTADRILTAQFAPTTTYSVMALPTPTEGGTVTGAGNYAAGSTCTLTAVANAGYTFTNWTEGDIIVDTSATYSFSVTADRILTAQFSPNTPYTITATANPTEGGTVNGDGDYPVGNTCTLRASSRPGYDFLNWTEGNTIVSTDATYSFTVTASRSLTANFVKCGFGVDDLPYTDNFDHYTNSTTAKTGMEPPCWSLAKQDVTMTNDYKPMIYYGNSTAHSGNYSLILNKRGIYAMSEFDGDVSTLQLSMYLKQTQAKYQLQVGVMSSLNNALSFVPIATIDNSSTDFQYVEVDFDSYTGDGHYIAFRNILASGNTGDYSCNYIDDINIHTAPCNGISANRLPYTDNFDHYTKNTTNKTGVEPHCWTLAHQDVSMTDEYKPMLYFSNAHSGSYSLILNKRGIYAMPAIDTNIRTLQLTMYLKQSMTKYQLQVGVMSSLSNASTFVPVATIDNSSTAFEQVTVNFSSYTGNGHYIAFRNILAPDNTGDFSCNYIDDLTVQVAPCTGIKVNDLPYTENFDRYTNSITAKTGVEPPCWTLARQDVNMTDEYKPMIYYSSANAHSGNYSLILNKRGIYAMPEFEGDVSTLQLSFYLKQTQAKYQLQVGVMSSLTSVSSFVPIETINNSSTDIEHVTVNFSSYTGNGHYIAFRNTLASGNSGDYSVNYIDDLTLSLPVMYTVTATANPSTGGTVTGAGEYASGTTCILAATPDADYTFDNWTEGNTVVSTNATYSFIVDANRTLTANFTHNIPVVICEIGVDDLPYTDNFDNYTNSTTAKTGVQPTCWTLAKQDVSMTNEYKPMIYYASANAHSGNYSLILNKRGIYAMPEFKGDVNTLQLSFYLKQTQTKYQLQVGVMSSLTNASTFTPVQTINNSSTNMEQVTVDFSSYTGNGHYIAFRNILASGNSGDYSINYIDDLTLELRPVNTCTGINVADLPYYEEFDSITTSTTTKTGVEPPCWTLVHQYVNMTDAYKPMIYYSPENAYTGDYSLILNKRGIYAMPAYNGDVTQVMLFISLKQPQAKYQLDVGVMSDLNDISTFESVGIIDNTGTDYQFWLIDFLDYTGNGHYIAFRNILAPGYTGDYSVNYIDHILLEPLVYYNVTALANPPEGGTITGAGRYIHRYPCTLTATPNENYTFANWTYNDTVVSTDSIFSFYIYDNYTLTANFTYTPPSYTVTATANPTAGGTVTGAGSYTSGSICTLTATPATGYNFTNWTSGSTVVSTNATYTFTVTSDSTLTANFTPIVNCGISVADLPYSDNFDSYTTSTTAKTGVEPPCWTLAKQDVTMTDEYKPMVYYSSANAHSGNYSLIINKRGIYAMPEFEGNVNTLQLSMYLKQSATKYQLQVGVMSNLDNASTFVPVATIDNSTSGVEHVTVNFSSYTGTGHYIAFRNILATGNSGDYSCNYIDDLTLSQPVVYTVAATANPTAGGTVTGAGSYTDGSTCTLTATPASGYTFTNWTVGNTVVSTNATYSFTVTANRTLKANFTPVATCGISLSDLPYSETFDNITTSTTAQTGVQPPCWTLAYQEVSMTNEYNPMIYYGSSNAHSGNYSLLLNKRGIYAMPEFDGNVNELIMGFYVLQTRASYRLTVGVMEDLSDPSTFTPVTTFNNSSTTDYVYCEVDFSSYEGSGRYIVFRNTNSAISDYSINYIDDITLNRATPPCALTVEDLPYTDNFDSYTSSTTPKTGVEPTCWTLAYQEVSMTDEYKPMVYYSSANAHSGNYALLLNKRGIYSMPAYTGDISTLQLSFYLKQTNSSYELTVGVMEDLYDPETFEPVISFNNETTNYVQQVVDFSSYSGTGHYIVFRNTNYAISNFSVNYIDDLTLETRANNCSITTADMPFSDNFDSYTSSTTAKTGVQPDCWTLVHQDVAMTDEYKPMIYYSSANAHSGSYSLILNKRCIFAMPEAVADVNTLQMEFYVRQTQTKYQLQVGVLTSLDDYTTFVPVATINNSSTTTSSRHVVNFSSYTGNGHYIAFRNILASGQTGDYSCNYIDDITLNSTSAAMYKGDTSDDSFAMDKHLTVYPNPTTGKLTVEADQEVVRVDVFDYTGRNVATYQSQSAIDLSQLATGIYTLRFTLPDRIEVRRVVKQ